MLKPCLNYCSKNGYCLGNVCYCIDGWAGTDCSTECDGAINNNTCVNSCPSGYAPSSGTKVCKPSDSDDNDNDGNVGINGCDPQCDGCSGTADNCSSCAGGDTRTGAPTCGCATGYYESGGEMCTACAYPCTTCENSPENCLTCHSSPSRNSAPDCQC